MRTTISTPAIARLLGALSTACLALVVAQAPAHAGGDVSNFNVKNCTSERIFVCSFDKTDSLMKIPYKARGIQPGDRKEFGCASIGRCKVIIGVSNKTAKRTLSSGMQAAIAAGTVTGAAVTGGGMGAALLAAGGFEASIVAAGGVAAGVVGGTVLATAVGGAIAGMEIADGWNDGEVCNQVRKAAEKAGMKPKDFLQNGTKYTVIEQYAVNKDGNPYVNRDGTAVFAYATKRGNTCPAPLKTQLVPN